MDFRQLTYFVAVAEELHFGNAAKRLHISQPPLSQQIMRFEEELGVKLFKRNKRSVALTPAGQCLLKDARQILASVTRAEHNLLAAAQGEQGTLRLGFITPALDTVLPDLIRRFKTAYPEVTLDLVEKFTNHQLEGIHKGEIDTGVVRLFKHDLKGLESRLFHREDYALIVQEDHPFARQATVDITELDGQPLVFFSRGIQPSLHDKWIQVFAAAGFMPHVVQEVSTKNAAQALVAANIGISIVPESLSRRPLPGVVFRPLTGGAPLLELHIVFKQGNDSPPLHNLLAMVQKPD